MMKLESECIVITEGLVRNSAKKLLHGIGSTESDLNVGIFCKYVIDY